MGRVAFRMEQVVNFVRDTVGRTGTVPSYATIGQELGIEYPGTVRRVVKQAVDCGKLALAPDYRRKHGARGSTRIVVPESFGKVDHYGPHPPRPPRSDIKTIPSGFCAVYVREGAETCRSLYNTSRTTISRWAMQCGPEVIQHRQSNCLSNARDGKAWKAKQRRGQNNYEFVFDGE